MWKYLAHKMYRSDKQSIHQNCQKGKSSFHFKYCTEYQFLKCNKHFYDHHRMVCCDKCDRWIHIDCAKIRLHSKLCSVSVILV